MSFPRRFLLELVSFPLVVFEQAAENGVSCDEVDLRRRANRNWVIIGIERPITQPLMRPQPIVVFGIVLNNMIEVLQPKTQEQ